MIRAKTKRAIVSRPAAPRSTFIRRQTFVRTAPANFHRTPETDTMGGSVDGVLSMVLLCVLAGVVLVGTAGIARTILSEVVRYGSADLLGVFSAI